MARCAVPLSGSGPTDMPKVAIVAALEREVSELTKGWSRVERSYDGHSFVFFDCDEMVVVCGGIGLEPARRAAEVVITLYHPTLLQSVGFAGALDAGLRVGDVFAPAGVVDARDGSRTEIEGGDRQGSLVTFMAVAGAEQKANLALTYGAQAVDMEAAAVAAAARAHGIRFGATKVISDELNFEIPQMSRFIDAQGRFRTASFAVFVAWRPWLWRRVAVLARNSRRAARRLGEHLDRFRQELDQGSCQGSEEIAASPTAVTRPTPHAAATSGLRAGERE
jgi:adenosylhomocysteine nucleosidase